MKNKTVFVFVAILVVIAGGFALWNLMLGDKLVQATAVLSLQPESGQFSTTSPFEVEVWVDTKNKPVGGTDVFLEFDPELMRAVDISFDDGVFPNTPAQEFIIRQSNTGLIRFSALVDPGGSFTGGGKVATISFEPIKSGIASVSFVFEEIGSTIDSNVQFHGEDMLGKVINGSYNLIDRQ